MAVLYFLRLRQAVVTTRGEQALLCLLPGTAHGAALNHWLAQQLARSALALVAVHALICLVAIALLGETHSAWGTASQSALLLSLCAVPSLWQDWSRAEPVSRQSPAQPGWMLWLPLAAMALNLAVQFLWESALPGLWLLQSLAAAGWALWRWRRLAHQPAAWPVGHAQR